MAWTGGYVATDLITPIFSEIDYAAYGKPFADAVYGGTLNIYEEAHLAIKNRSTKDEIGRTYSDLWDVTLDVTYICTKIKTLYDRFLLSTNGPQNIRCKRADGTWFNFVDNGVHGTGTLTYPGATGSVLLNDTFMFEADGSKRTIKSKYQGGMYLGEYLWLLNNGASGATGGSSGAAITGLTQLNYDINQYAPIGITDILIGSYSLGALEDQTKVSLDFKEQGFTLTRKQPILAFCNAKIQAAMWQTSIPNELLQGATWANNDITVTIKFADGMQFIFVNCFLPASNFSGDSKKNVQTMDLECHLPIDSPSWGGTNIAFNVAANTVTFTKTAMV